MIKWIEHLTLLKDMQSGGCRFSFGDLTLLERRGLSELNHAIEAIKAEKIKNHGQ